jgi:hypothetical protein
MLEHIERLKAWQAWTCRRGIERLVHQNRLLKIAREGGQMTPADLAKFEPQRRYATLVALAIEGMATVTDEIIDLHDRIMASCSTPPRTNISSSSRLLGKAINDKVRLYGRIGQACSKPNSRRAIRSRPSRPSCPGTLSPPASPRRKSSRSRDFDFLHASARASPRLRRYAPEFLAVLKLRARPPPRACWMPSRCCAA